MLEGRDYICPYIPAHPFGECKRRIWRFFESELLGWVCLFVGPVFIGPASFILELERNQ
jgi:hypothetical protein